MALEVMVNRPHELQAIDIVIYEEVGEVFRVYTTVPQLDGSIAYGWVEVQEGDEMPLPTLRIPRVLDKKGIVQEMVNKFKEVLGIVAEGETPDKGELKATERHLEDMRAIVFGFEKIELKRTKPMAMEEI